MSRIHEIPPAHQARFLIAEKRATADNEFLLLFAEALEVAIQKMEPSFIVKGLPSDKVKTLLSKLGYMIYADGENKETTIAF